MADFKAQLGRADHPGLASQTERLARHPPDLDADRMGTPERRRDRSGPSRAGFAHPTGRSHGPGVVVVIVVGLFDYDNDNDNDHAKTLVDDRSAVGTAK